MANQLWRANQYEPACFRLTLSLVLPVTFGHIAACRSAALALSAAIHFVMKISAPCFAVLCHSPSSWAAIIHLSGWMPKTLRSSRRHPIHSVSGPPAEPAPPTSSPNITHFGRLSSRHQRCTQGLILRYYVRVRLHASPVVVIARFRFYDLTL